MVLTPRRETAVKWSVVLYLSGLERHGLFVARVAHRRTQQPAGVGVRAEQRRGGGGQGDEKCVAPRAVDRARVLQVAVAGRADLCKPEVIRANFKFRKRRGPQSDVISSITVVLSPQLRYGLLHKKKIGRRLLERGGERGKGEDARAARRREEEKRRGVERRAEERRGEASRGEPPSPTSARWCTRTSSRSIRRSSRRWCRRWAHPRG